MKSADLAVINCEQLLTCRGRIPKRADSLQDVGILEKGCIASHKGRIVFVGDEKRLKKEVRLEENGHCFIGRSQLPHSYLPLGH